MSNVDIKNVFGFTTRKTNELLNQYNIRDVKTLRSYIRKIPNILNDVQLISLRYHNHVDKLVSREEITPYVSYILKNIKADVCGMYRITNLGNIKYIKELMFITTVDLKKQIDILEKKNIIISTLIYSDDKYVGIIKMPKSNIIRILHIIKTTSVEKPFIMLFNSSSKEFLNNMKRTAKRNKYLLTIDGLFDNKNKLVLGIKKEEDIFRILKIKYIHVNDRYQF